MRRLIAAMKKEVLLLIRDRIGLSILFVMPMVLITVMTLIQDAAFSNINEDGVPVVFINNDNDTLGNRIEEGLKNAEMVKFFDEVDGQKATPESARSAIKEGQFLVGVIIPKGATEAVEDNVLNIVAESMGMEEEGEVAGTKTAEIKLIIDPVASKSFVISISSQLREFISAVKTQIMFETFKGEIAEMLPEEPKGGKSKYAGQQVILYDQEFASTLVGEIAPGAVQHNVPAWTIFSLFFIVIPLVGSIMREKTEGSVFRFHTIPTSYLLQTNAKVIVYIGVCMIQFLLMLAIGLFLMPILGMDKLMLGNSYIGIFIIALASSMAATGYGVLVGALAATQQQGAILGSLSILVLSALGGIWIPTYVMPDVMRMISHFSPLNWSLDGFYGLFLRGEGLMEILPQVGLLVCFFIICLALATYLNKLKRKV
ncbi:MAG: ABC transporter permease [Crocinitomicaceae bacterium]|nr:ABC transporter permease [Crocinitomicaceae bacterium]